MFNDTWFTVTQIDEATFAISEYGHWEKVHSFLLIGSEKAILIDTGLGIDTMKRITDQLTELPIDVVTTHVHVDHIGSHGAYERIYVHEAEKEWLIHGIQGLSLEQIRHDIARDITKPTPPTFTPNTYTPFQGEPTGCLQDEQFIALGHRTIRVLHTPGHSPGHLCFFDETNGYLFTGDVLYDETPIYAFYPTTDPVALVQSLERLTTIQGVRMIFGSHNTLGLPPAILQEVKGLVRYVRDNHLVRFGTGVHQFGRLRVQF